MSSVLLYNKWQNISTFCGIKNGLCFAVAYFLHVLAVRITAYSCAKYRLWQIVAYIQPELAPHFLPDTVCHTIMYSCSLKKCLYCLYPCAVIRLCKFSKDYSNSCFRVKIKTFALFMGCNFYQRTATFFICIFPLLSPYILNVYCVNINP